MQFYSEKDECRTELFFFFSRDSASSKTRAKAGLWQNRWQYFKINLKCHIYSRYLITGHRRLESTVLHESALHFEIPKINTLSSIVCSKILIKKQRVAKQTKDTDVKRTRNTWWSYLGYCAWPSKTADFDSRWLSSTFFKKTNTSQ